MFNQQFFDEVLGKRVGEKSMESPDGDQASVVIKLHDGNELKVAGLVETGAGWVVVKVYPAGSKKLREFKRAKDDRGPRFDLDHVAVTYGAIQMVEVTLSGKKKGLGFTETR